MIIHKMLDNVFTTKSNIAVVRVISKVKVGLSGREIAKQGGVSASSSLEALTVMENLNLAKRERQEGSFLLSERETLYKYL